MKVLKKSGWIILLRKANEQNTRIFFWLLGIWRGEKAWNFISRGRAIDRYLQDRMFVDYSLENLFRVFFEM